MMRLNNADLPTLGRPTRGDEIGHTIRMKRRNKTQKGNFHLLGVSFKPFLKPMKRWLLVTSGWVMLAVAALILLYQLANILLSPPSYKASAFVEFTAGGLKQKAQRELVCHHPSFLFSTNVLYPACDSIDLAEKWSKRYMTDGTFLTEKEVIALLTRRISLSYSKNEDEPVRITIFSEKPDEAIEIANAIAASLQSQLARLEGPMDNEQDVQIQNAITAQRTSPWFMILAETLIIVVPLSVIGVIMIWLGRQLPSPPPVPSKPDVKIFPKY
jgi:hypothetical protein